MCTTLLLFITGSLLAQETNGKPQAQITFRVATDGGKPVQNIEVSASTFLRLEPGEGFGKDIYQDFKGRTDEKGLTTISFSSGYGDCKYGIYNISGYYSTRNLEYHFKPVADGKWQPWNPTIDVVLKPIVNPIPMYGRKVGFIADFLELPKKGEPIGFDLVAADWVAPYGKGSAADLVFTLTEAVPYVSIQKPFDVTLTVSFSNKGDGIQSVLVPINKGSDLRLPRYAPENGYEPMLVKHHGRPAEGKPINAGIEEDQNYFFRVRTIIDEKGKIKSALYGKINGDIALDIINSKTGLIQISYCLNPNAGDRNMEFDPDKNLFPGLEFNKRVTTP